MIGQPEINGFIVNELLQDLQNVSGDNPRCFNRNWYKYTKNTNTLDIVTNGLKLELNEKLSQYSSSTCPLLAKENEMILLKKLLKKNTTEYNEFISVIFTMNKKDGSEKMILNLKNFKKFVNYKYFKMESINNVLNNLMAFIYLILFCTYTFYLLNIFKIYI